MNTFKLMATFMNSSMIIGTRLYTVQAPDLECARAFVKGYLSISGLRTLEIEDKSFA